jgi:hypothetical protein
MSMDVGEFATGMKIGCVSWLMLETLLMASLVFDTEGLQAINNIRKAIEILILDLVVDFG